MIQYKILNQRIVWPANGNPLSPYQHLRPTLSETTYAVEVSPGQHLIVLRVKTASLSSAIGDIASSPSSPESSSSPFRHLLQLPFVLFFIRMLHFVFLLLSPFIPHVFHSLLSSSTHLNPNPNPIPHSDANANADSNPHHIDDEHPSPPTRPPLLFIHGISQNRHTWHVVGRHPHPQDRSLLHHLALAGFDCFAMDLPGSRDSLLSAPSSPPLSLAALLPSPPPSLRLVSSLLIPRLLSFIRALTAAPAVSLVGHSLGGAVACAVAGHCPQQVAAVVTMAGLYRLGEGWGAEGSSPLALLRGGEWALAKAALFWRLVLALRPHRWLPWRGWGRLPTRFLGILGTIAEGSCWRHLIPLQVALPDSLGPRLAHRHRYASFEDTSVEIIMQILSLAEYALLSAKENENENENEDNKSLSLEQALLNFERQTHIPLLCLSSRHDTFVHHQDSAACYHRAQALDKTTLSFGAPLSYSCSSTQDIPTFLSSHGCRPQDVTDSRFGHLDLILGDSSIGVIWPILTQWLQKKSKL